MLRDLKAGPDLLLVLGTSLRHDGPRQLVRDFSRVIQRHGKGGKVILVDRCLPSASCGRKFTDMVKGDCDDRVQDVVCRMTLLEEAEKHRQGQIKIVSSHARKSRGSLRRKKELQGKLLGSKECPIAVDRRQR